MPICKIKINGVKCKHDATYGVPGTIVPLCCRTCKDSNVAYAAYVDVKSKKCKICNIVNASFGPPDGKREVCKGCKTKNKLDNYILLNHKKCLYVDKQIVTVVDPATGEMKQTEITIKCHTTACFGEPGDKKPTRCGPHRTATMVDLVNNLCRVTVDGKECGVQAHYNFPNEKRGKFCATHGKDVVDEKGNRMVDVVSMKCDFPGCKIRASFGILSPTRCDKHCDRDKMKSFSNTECIEEGCNTSASYTLNGIDVLYCGDHKVRPEGIAYLKNGKRCIGLMPDGTQCQIQPCFGVPGSKITEYCFDHKPGEYVNIKNKLCVKCNTIKATYGPLFGPKLHCAKCKDNNDLFNNNPKCTGINCKEKPYYIAGVSNLGNVNANDITLPDNLTKEINDMSNNISIDISKTKSNKKSILKSKALLIPTHCEKHKGVADIMTGEVKCIKCQLSYHMKHGENICVYCEGNEIINERVKTKELNVKNFLTESGFIFQHDTVVNDCSKRRPDFKIDGEGFIIIIEVDEKSHLDRNTDCETTRMKEIFYASGGTPVVFIRYNPDTYKEHNKNKNIADKIRQEKLKLTINNITFDFAKKAAVQAIYLYYTGIPIGDVAVILPWDK